MSNGLVPTPDRAIHRTATGEVGSFAARGVTVVAFMAADAQPTKTTRAPAAAHGLPTP